MEHGIILVNYREYNKERDIGQYVDAASFTRIPGQTFAIFEFPKIIPPRLVSNGSVYTVLEDSIHSRGVDVSTRDSEFQLF